MNKDREGGLGGERCGINMVESESLIALEDGRQRSRSPGGPQAEHESSRKCCFFKEQARYPGADL